MERPPIGTTLMGWGHHWRVVGHVQHDGEPGVRLKCLSSQKKNVYANVVTAALRHTTETDPDIYKKE